MAWQFACLGMHATTKGFVSSIPGCFLEEADEHQEVMSLPTQINSGASQILAPYAHWDIPVIGQAYILFRARLAPPFEFGSGTESLETRLFAPHEIPFEKVCPQPLMKRWAYWGCARAS